MTADLATWHRCPQCEELWAPDPDRPPAAVCPDCKAENDQTDADEIALWRNR